MRAVLRAAQLSRAEVMALLEVRAIAKRYADTAVFEGVDLEIGRGEFVAILGESGVGKSTLLNCIAGLDTIDAGSIGIDGVRVDTLPEPEQALLRRNELGFVFQAFHVLPHLDVAHNVGLPLLLQGRHDTARVAAALAAVGLEALGARLPQTLSGGQLQRVAIARALIARPALLVADEPVSMVDASLRSAIVELFRTLRDELGVSIVYITHDLATAWSISDRVVIMRRGVMVESGAARATLDHPQHPYSMELKNAVLSPDVPPSS